MEGMSARYLLDTNIASYVIKRQNPHVDKRLERVGVDQVAISVITEAELRFGLARMPEALRLQSVTREFLARVTILAWDSPAAETYGELRAALECAGKPLGALDTLIAAHALSTGMVLVTRDQAFRNVKKLGIEDWTHSS
jgi:tRNA(fMet)-specific endonuclease VapC